MTTSFQEIALDALQPSPTNPRKRLGPLDDLVESIRAQGILQPIVARARTKGYEIVCGHRRTEAARVAGLAKIPAMVRDLSDEQVLEAQLVENLERADMHPLEEAEAIHAMLQRPGWTQQRVAEKIGRSIVFVAQRVQLLTLSPKCRKALDEEKISVGVALELARIGNPKTQDEALEDIRPDWQDVHPTVERARRVIQERFRLQLGKATFDTTDANLVPAAGACSTCPKRTGNQTSLFADIKSPDLCTDPVCFRSKLDATFKARSLAAKKEGLKVVTKKEEVSSAVRGWNKEWVALEHKEYLGTGAAKTVRQIVGKEVAPAAIAQDPDSGQIVELVPKAVLDKALRSERKAAPGQKIRKSSEVEAEKKRKLEQKIEALAKTRAAAKAREGAKKLDQVELQKALVAALVVGCGMAFRAVEDMHDSFCPDEGELEDELPNLASGERKAFLAEFALRVLLEESGFELSKEAGLALGELVRALEIDWPALLADARKELTPAPKEPKAKAKKVPAKKKKGAAK